MALTTTPVYDDFSSTLGAYWTPDGGWYTQDGVLLTDGNTGSSGAYYLLYESGETEQHAQVDVANNGSLSHAVHLLSRATDDNNYVAAYVSSGDFKVRVKVGGTSSQTYNNTSTGITSSSSYTIGLKVIGDTYYAYLNGVLEHSGSAGGLTGTKAGLQSGDTNTNRVFDNFRIALPQESVNTLSGGDPMGGDSLVVSAGEDVTQNIETEVTLTATAAYTGGGEVTYLWEQISEGASISLPADLSTQSITFNLPNSAEVYELQVTATDGALTSVDSVLVTATDASSNPATEMTIHYDGDSIGNYIGQQRSYLVAEAETLNSTATATNNSAGGHYARTVLIGIDDVISGFTGVNDIVVVQIGTNDERDTEGNVLSEPEYTEQFNRCMAEYTARIAQAGGKVALTAKTISASEEANNSDGNGSRNLRNKNFIQQYNPEFWDDENSRPVLDYFELTRGGHSAEPTWFRDNYHPSDYGSQEINKYTARQLVPIIPSLFKDTGITVITNGNQDVGLGETVTLDASSTFEEDFNIVSFKWTQYYGESVEISNSDESISSFTAPNTEQELIFKVTATINGTDFEEQYVIINTVESLPANVAPTANAGIDQSVAAGATVQLDGTGSTDGDGTIVSYAWAQTAGDAVILTGASTSTPSFTAPSTNAQQTLTFELTVTDNDAQPDTDTVDVTVEAEVVQPIESTLNLTVSGITAGLQALKLWSETDDSIVFNSTAMFTDEAAVITLSVPAGTVITGRWLGTNPPTTGTGVYGVTV